MFEVVCVEDGAFGDMAQAVGSVGANVGVGTNEDAKVAQVSTNLADRLRADLSPGIAAILVLCGERAGQEGDKMGFDADWTGSWSATTMRGATGFVKIEMDDI